MTTNDKKDGTVHKQCKTIYIALALTMIAFTACGRAGDSTSGSGDATVGGATITGNIISQSGTSTEMDGWQIALIDIATGESRVSEISGSGTFTFYKVNKNSEYTLALFNTDMRLTSLLSMVSASIPGTVYQYFKLKSDVIPRIVFKGPSMELSDTDSVTILTYTAEDSDSDGIPDGMESDTELALQSNLKIAAATTDIDSDGILNAVDFDIDGDGLPNWLDNDDDGNDTLDIFDLDANSDLVLDSAQKIGDHYFGNGVEYIAVQVFHKSDGVINIRFAVKVDGITPKTVSILGSTDFFDQSLIVEKGDSGIEEARDIWDLTLNDDGQSQDDSEDDGLYAQKVKIKAGKTFKSNQAVFIRLTFDDYSRDFPFLFPDIETDEFEFSYDADSREVEKSGDPFGEDEEGYVWFVSVYNEEGALVHTSGLIDATEGTYTIPEDDISNEETYTAKIYAQTLEKVVGFPIITVESEEQDLE